jgi:hypothetical protein
MNLQRVKKAWKQAAAYGKEPYVLCMEFQSDALVNYLEYCGWKDAHTFNLPFPKLAVALPEIARTKEIENAPYQTADGRYISVK